jgi:hypothetical protein
MTICQKNPRMKISWSLILIQFHRRSGYQIRSWTTTIFGYSFLDVIFNSKISFGTVENDQPKRVAILVDIVSPLSSILNSHSQFYYLLFLPYAFGTLYKLNDLLTCSLFFWQNLFNCNIIDSFVKLF